MAGLTGILQIGKSSLISHQSGIATASHNAANAGVAGFSKRDVEFGALGVQSGVGVSHIRRRADNWIERRMLLERSRVGTQESKAAALDSIELQFSDDGGGIGPALDGFFGSLRSLSAAPADAQLRADVLSKARTLTESISVTARRIQIEREQTDDALGGAVSRVNEIATMIATLNQRIGQAEAGGHEASDDRDRRDQLVAELAEHLEITTFTAPDGSMTVLIAGGPSLVQGAHASSLQMVPDAAYGGYARVDLVDPSGLATDMTTSLKSGSVGGLLDVRDGFLADLETRLDQFAFDLATNFNATHVAGFGTDGVSGRNFFAPPGAVAGAAQALTLDAGLDTTVLAAAGTAAEAIGGNDNLLALIDLADATIAGGGVVTLNEEVSAMVGEVGQVAAQHHFAREQSNVQLSQVTAMKEAQTGVSIDEELIDITRYERAYQAGAKVIQVVDEMFQTLLSL